MKQLSISLAALLVGAGLSVVCTYDQPAPDCFRPDCVNPAPNPDADDDDDDDDDDDATGGDTTADTGSSTGG